MRSRYSLLVISKTVLVPLLTLSFLLVSSIPMAVFAQENVSTSETAADTIAPTAETADIAPAVDAVAIDTQAEPTKLPAEETLTPTDETKPAETDESAMEKPPQEESLAPEAMAAMAASGAPGSGDASPLKTSSVDSTSGSFQTSFPIVVPPGRNGMQPNLVLQYDSGAANQTSIFGYGWDINIPSIGRVNKTGSENLYATSSSVFYSSLSGELVPTGVSNEYRARIESGNFLKYIYNNNVWTVTDKAGRTYTFGSASTSRQDNPADANQIYKWFIDSEKDTNNNAVSYSYFKDAGQIYPNIINYTKNGADNGIFTVVFERELRLDTLTSYQSRFAVKSNYRIKKIYTTVEGVTARSYALVYSAGDNQKRSLLTSVTESGTEGAVTVTRLPQTFEYKNTSTQGWVSTSTWQLPVSFTTSNLDNGLRPVDINGDSFLDLVRFYKAQAGQEYKTVFINNGINGWSTSTTWNWSDMNLWFTVEGSTESPRNDYGTRFLDVNGDGLTDAITGFDDLLGGTDVKKVFLNTGSGWSLSLTWTLPVFITSKITASTTIDLGVRTGDINGDRLPDIVVSYLNSSNGINQEVYINNGLNGWDLNTSWVVPEVFTNCSTCSNPGQDLGAHLIDINGDGLDDIVRASAFTNSPNINKVYVNTGTGWVLDSSIQVPIYFINVGDEGMRWAEVNGDGLIDLVRSTPTTRALYLNNGAGWTAVGQLPPINLPFIDYSGDIGVRIADVDGDGLADFLGGGGVETHLNRRDFGDSLSGITFKEGGKIGVSYLGSAEYRNGNQLLNLQIPYTFPTVLQLQYDSNNGAQWNESYIYENGFYHYASTTFRDRTFAGFGKITKTGPRAKVVSYYHQNNGTNSGNGETTDSYAKIGLEYKTTIDDLAGNNYVTTVNKWGESSLAGGASYINQQSQSVLTYDGDSDHRDTAVAYTYDSATGNLVQKIEYGEVTGATDGTFTDTGSDRFTTAYTYAASTTNPLFTAISTASTTDQANGLARYTKYYYDTGALGVITKGNLTKQENWATTSIYSTNQWEYNNFGMVGTTTDARGNVSSVRYDSYNLYPALAKNALGHIVTSTYDYSSGQTKSTTDANGSVFTNNYDGLDRLVEEYIPDPDTGSSVQKTVYTYYDTAIPVRIDQANYLNQLLTVDAVKYFDGFGQLVQTRQDMEKFNKYAVTDFVFGDGVLIRESVPYEVTSANYTSPTVTQKRLRSYLYDALDRKISVADMRGTSTIAYDQWQTVTTDPLSHIKKTNNDAYGNLVGVVERNSGVDYTTTYTYDYGGKLTSITDALNNVRKYMYDGLGRRVYAEDLHTASSSTFGVWRYEYDLAGNVGTTTNPMGQIVLYAYDALNRILTENAASSTGVEISYGYDGCTKGIGRLCSVVSAPATTSYAYNAIGSTATETKQIRSVSYVTNNQYDRQGNLVTVTYPDNSQVRNTYNNAGLLEKVEQKENGGIFKNVVTAFDYNPAQKVTLEVLANGATTTKTYDTIHRLTKILTTTYSAAPTGICPTQIMGSTLDTNLISFWNHNESSTGASAVTRFDGKSTNHLTDFNTTLSGVGKLNNAADLESTSAERLSITDAAQTGLDTQNDMTFATWLKFESLPGTNGRMYVVQKEDIFKFAPDWDISGTDYLRVYFRDSVGYYDAKVSWVPFTNTWYHVAFTRNKTTGEVKFFVNGLQQGSTVSTGRTATLLNSIEDFNIGANPGEFDGMVDETGMWSRVLTASEISCLYNSGNGLSYSIGGIGGGGQAMMELLAVSSSDELLNSADATALPVIEPSTKKVTSASSTESTYDVLKQELEIAKPSDRGTIRGKMIAERVISGKRVVRGENSMDVFGVEPIEGGVQVYLRAFDKQGNQLGFAKDGSVDIERFKIYNPPIMVPDGTYRDEEIERLGGGTQIIKTPNFTLNPEEALYQVLEQAIKTTGKNNKKIIPQKIGRTTSIFYPNDGWAEYDGSALSWTGIKNANGTGSAAGDVTRYVVAAVASTSPNKFSNLRRGIFIFNTDPIPETDQVTGATMSVVATARGDHDLVNERFLNISAAATANDGSISASDYQLQNQYDIAFSDDKSIKTEIPIDGNTYANWQFNSEGIANVNRSGYSKFGLKFIEDIYGNDMLWNAGYNYGLSIRLSETSGTTLDPKLVVEHGAATSTPTTTVIQNISYTYDAADNITKITDVSSTVAAKTVDFTYDDLNRLTRASTTVASSTPFLEQYTYNAIGNFLTKTGQGTYSYAGTGFANPHAPTTIGTSTLTYDQNGNLASYNGVTYTSNYKSQLTTLQKNATTTRYTYDHLGQRLEKARGTGTTTYVGGGYEVAPGNSVTKYIYAGGELVATIAGIGTTTTSYIHRDHLSSTNVTTNQSGAVSTVLDYYPYGSPRIESGTPPQRQYIGQYDDSESDLAYLNARYYDSSRGQFASQDPVFWEVGESRDGIVSLYNPQFQNSYSYAANNPIVNKDPDGRFLDLVVDAGFIAYDLYKVGTAIATGGDVRSELSYLALDVAGAATPFATGFGAAARTVKVAENAGDIISASNKSENTYSVYDLLDKSGNVVYTGITKQDPKRRFAQHMQDSFKAGVVKEQKIRAGNLTRTEARLMEQASIEARGGVNGGQLLNQRNSISPNSKLYKSAESSIKSASRNIANGNYDKAAKDLQKASRQLNKLKR